MKRDNFRDKTSLFLGGKELLIILVVIFSALSFTLGYFVGKFGKTKQPENVLQSSPAAPELPEPQELQSTTHTSDQEVSTEGASQQEIKPLQPELVVMPEKTTRETPKQSAEKTQKADKKANTSSDPDIKPQKNEPVYTVQLNALKNSAEADKFKAKYEKKGYKIYIVVANDKKKNHIYKIRTGEFRDKKDADILSLKIRKAEGLNTFITLKNR